MSSNKKGGSSSLKQGTLFSFFAKKAKTSSTGGNKPSSSSSSGGKTSATTSSSANTKTVPKQSSSSSSTETTDTTNISSGGSGGNNSKWKKVTLNCRIAVYWPEDKKYYNAIVQRQRGSSSSFYLEYEIDNETEWIDLGTEDFKILPDSDTATATSNSGEDTSSSSTKSGAKRRRIQEDDDDDDEFEFDDEVSESGDDDDGSVYDPKVAPKDNDDEALQIDIDADDEDDDKRMITDAEEEDSDEISKRAKKKLKKSSFKVTPISPKGSTSCATVKATPSSQPGRSFTDTPLSQFANTASSTVTPPQSSNGSSYSQSTPRTQARPSNSLQSPPLSTNNNNNNERPRALPYVENAMNERGAHIHNHLKFVQFPRDASGKRHGEPGSNPRTLRVDHNEWNRQNKGKAMTNAVRQWWDIKSQYFDTVLLFKTGKFYEMFHMDADLGVEVCGFKYMKGHVAHAGFPEIGYSGFADKLVRAGYKVARVEQTETPEMLAERKSKVRKGQKKPMVVNREVCSILTLGTRTFCALDVADDDGLTALTDSDNNNGGAGPLLAISEVLVESMETDNNDNDDENENEKVRPVCEYGVTMVNAVHGVVTIGQFADDVLRSRMDTLLTSYCPSEILVQSGEGGASPTLLSLLKSYQTTSRTTCSIETILTNESFPKSNALNENHRRLLERTGGKVKPWDVPETINELHRRSYYPRGSRTAENKTTSRWPKVLHAAVDGDADLCLSSFGAALFYLQRNLIDQEILSMGIVKAYIPPATSLVSDSEKRAATVAALEGAHQDEERESGFEASPIPNNTEQISSSEDQIKHMSLDGTTLTNLEILTNSVDHKVAGSLWSKINYTKSPHGSRLLRAWLLRPLFRKADIERRGDAVQELVSGAGAVALNEARQCVLSRTGDLERLLSRVHSMSGANAIAEEIDPERSYPNDRAIMYDTPTYTKRKVADFSKLLNGLKLACQIPEIFGGLQLQEDGLLRKIVRLQDEGGLFPNMSDELDYFFENFDTDKASKGLYEPAIDEEYNEACDTINRILGELNEYRIEMCNQLSPRHTAKSSWKYVNTKPESKDKYLIELPASVAVPDDFLVKGKRGTGAKQINKYRTPIVGRLVQELESAFEVQATRKALGMQLIFAKFDSKRSLWVAAAHATAFLDALGSLAKTAGKPGYCRPSILDCPPDVEPTINVVQGRHPCVESSVHSSEFIPNDLCLGRAGIDDSSRLLLLSGPNMGGKSTLLRQTCLITILAQIGSYVPAESCELTPIDCIFTRLGASDRILLGQSTFFVELAEMATAMRGATRRSLVIMDELGRGTSTFDGTAIAHAAVKHLVERCKCISLFATHYHSILDMWKNEPEVRLGHMQCMVEDEDDGDENANGSITFLYSLGPGTCPKSFGVNVARLASLPEEVLSKAKLISEEFEQDMSTAQPKSADEASGDEQQIFAAIEDCKFEEVERIWRGASGMMD